MGIKHRRWVINRHTIIAFYCVAAAILSSAVAQQSPYFYAAVISKTAYADAGWKAVADSLVKKHSRNGTARLFTWSSSVTDCKSDLSAFKPDYIGYIARPVSECSAAFIATVSRLSRGLDDDPYGDAVWGIITGYEAPDALRAISDTLTVKTVFAASGNLSYEPPIQRFYQGIGMTCDSYTKTDYLFPGRSGEIYTEEKRPEGERDRIKLVAKWLNAESINLEVAGQGAISGPIDCIITGGHGNVNLWQCHYPDAGSEGYMRSSGGQLYGAPASGGSIAINAPTPKILWCASNCLMGNPNSRDNIVYAAFHTGRAVQMFGFVNSASGGDEFMAWGVYDRVTKFAGKHTLAEGFFLSNNNALFEINHSTGQMTVSLVRLFMDSTVFYGDPAGKVVFHDVGDPARAYKTDLTFLANSSGSTDFIYTFTMVAHNLEFGPGYCYQFRPISRLPVRIDPGSIAITKNEGHTPEITDNLLIWEILSKGETLRKGASKTLQWTAKVADDRTGTVRGCAGQRSRNTALWLTMAHGAGGPRIRCGNLASGPAVLRIVDQAGRECFMRRLAAGPSERNIRLPVGLAAGVYGAALAQGGASSSVRFAVVR